MESFFRFVKLKAHFKYQYNEKLNKQQKWIPNKIHHSIETYIEAAEKELKQQGKIGGNKGYSNLSKVERIALKEVSDRTDTIITKTNKGGAVVIMDVKGCINEAHRQLNNKDHYKN